MSSNIDSSVNNLGKGGHEFWGFEKYNSKQKELLIKLEKEFIPMNTWIVGISLKKNDYRARMSFTAS